MKHYIPDLIMILVLVLCLSTGLYIMSEINSIDYLNIIQGGMQ
jgi:hypothetical protein